MKAPDKLYLHPNYKGEVGANWLTVSLTNEDECYIRKDVLLEWAKETYLNENASAIRKVCYKQLVDKLESL